MSEVTSPILLDSTGQTTNTKLDAINTTLGQIKNVITTPSDAEDISYDNTSSGMTADNVQEAVDELNASLVDLKSNLTVNVSTANNITYTKEGNKRRIDCRWATWANIQSFYANLSSDDRTTKFYVGTFICVDSGYNWGRMAYIGTENNGTALVGQVETNYNTSGAPISINDAHLLIGSLEWYVS